MKSKPFAINAMNTNNTAEGQRKAITDLREALRVALDQIDYVAGNCRPNEMVGAVLDWNTIVHCRLVLERTKGAAQ